MNNNKQDKWVNELKQRLDNYSESIDENSFVLLKKKIDEQNKINFSNKRKIIFWSSGIAAIGLLFLFLTMFHGFLNNDLNIQNIDFNRSGIIQTRRPAIIARINPIKQIRHMSNRQNRMANIDEDIINNLSEHSSKERNANVKEDNNDSPRSAHKNIANNSEYLQGNTSQYIEGNTEKIYVHKRNYSIALITGGGAMINNSSNLGTNYNEMRFCCNMLNFDNVLYTNNNPVYTDYDFDYKVPLTFGLLLRNNISGTRFALESGIQMTKMSTNITGSENRSANCDFIYVGLPIRFSYNIISKPKFSSYISLGFTIEKCISTNYKGEDMIYFTNENKVKNMSEITPQDMPWQLSNTLSFGVQGRLTSSASIFVEPGLIYYYKTKDSLIPNMRKEYPFNMNMMFGIRFNL